MSQSGTPTTKRKKGGGFFRSQGTPVDDQFDSFSFSTPVTTNATTTTTTASVTSKGPLPPVPPRQRTQESNGNDKNNDGNNSAAISSSSTTTPSTPNSATNQREESRLEMLDSCSSEQPFLLAGEKELHSDTLVFEWSGRHWVQGMLILTNYRIYFQPNNVSTYDDVPVFKGSDIPLTSIARIEKVGGKTSRGEHAYLMEVYTKDLRVARFSFLPSRATRGRICKFVREERPQTSLFCFDHKISKDGAASNVDMGWDVYTPLKEYARQGLNFSNGSSARGWRLCQANQNYKISETYPREFVVPDSLTDEDIRLVAAFRSKGRIPILSYYDQETGCALTRSSQPLMGFGLKGTKRSDDYKMIEAIMQASGSDSDSVQQSPLSRSDSTLSTSSQASKEKLMIIDLRPLLNAEANRLKSGGYEKNYKNTEIKFMGIDNIHVMRRSFLRLYDLCITTGGACENFMTKVEQTSWLEYIRLILLAAKVCVDCIQKDRLSILLHCSDGWDRTAQVSALTQVMLDPYYRTIEGFAVLVEKEWLAYGHQFFKRIGHGLRNFAAEDRGPIFLQFLETVYQLTYQYPTAFEFNDEFLMYIMDSVYNCRFGTFLFDNAREREMNGVRERCYSVWTQFLGKKSSGNEDSASKYRNPFYDPDRTSYALIPDCRQSEIQFWSSYYLRYSKQYVAQEFSTPPTAILMQRGFDILDEINRVEETYQTELRKNEATVAIFQRELKSLMIELDKVKQEKQELQEKYDRDTAELLEMCERQKEELCRWTANDGRVGADNKMANESSTSAAVLDDSDAEEEEDADDSATSSRLSTPRHSVTDGSNLVGDLRAQLEAMRVERDNWQAKAESLANEQKADNQ